MKYVPPGPDKQSFTCPRCGVLAQQKWYPLLYDPGDWVAWISKWAQAISRERNYSSFNQFLNQVSQFLNQVSELPSVLIPVIESPQNRLTIAFCQHCSRFTLWLGDAMIYPLVGEAPPPHEEMPPRIRELYEEARGVLPASPRASAALLRVVLEGLLEEAGYRQGRLADRLEKAREDGKLSASTYKLAETLRYAGNAAAHYEPWKINPSEGEEDREMVYHLFGFVNRVTEELIARPRQDEEIARKINERVRKERS
jgi:hypothetical protein